MSSIVGFELDPKEQSTLAQMVELGLVNFIAQFEEISTCASKEFALEQKLKNMMAEWEHVMFECIPYRCDAIHKHLF
jgi:dynein heavy chain